MKHYLNPRPFGRLAAKCLLLVLMLLPQMAWADTKKVYYLKADSTVSSCSAEAIDGSSSETTLSAGDYYVDGEQTFSAPLIIGGNVRIILLDGQKLWALGCIVVEGDNQLTITCGSTTENIKGTGALYAQDTYANNDGDNARIGSREGNKCGTIIINGGEIEAYSTYTGGNVWGADIGSGGSGSGGSITINRGTVTCYGAYIKDECDMGAACIGSGYKSGGISITINGGTVKAYGTDNKNNDGAVIGTGYVSTDSVKITINGGTVTAIGSTNGYSEGAGIGTGSGSTSYFSINITGGIVEAGGSTAEYVWGKGAGIGSGSYCESNGTINISGGKITAYSANADGAYGAGIGTGNSMSKQYSDTGSKYTYYETVAEINISGGEIKAFSGVDDGYGAGIGSGYYGREPHINISGGKIEAYCSYCEDKGFVMGSLIGRGRGYAAGIGMGCNFSYNKDAGFVNITGNAKVKAVSSKSSISYGAGIGAGDSFVDGAKRMNIYINTTDTVWAYSSEYYDGFRKSWGAGIGGGDDGGCESITISGGVIYAECAHAEGASMKAAGIGNGNTSNSNKITTSITINGNNAIVYAYGNKSLSAEKVTAKASGDDMIAIAKMGKKSKTITSSCGKKELNLMESGSSNMYANIEFKDVSEKIVFYKDDKGETQSIKASPLTEGGELSGTYYVEGNQETERITVKDSLRLILIDGCKLEAKGCIVVEGSNKLTITSGNFIDSIAGKGYLYVTDEVGGNAGDDARIGSREENGCGYITINGGIIYAYSTYKGTYSVYGADIGSGYKGDQGCIVINGGEVNCYGGHYNTEDENSMAAAGIGSGKDSGKGTVWIRINGGKVFAAPTANEKSWGAGIGTGENATGRADIIINGGSVEALSSTNYLGYGAGIGTGDTYKASDNTTIEINGGDVWAWSCRRGDSKKAYGAGIGMGDAWDDDYGKVDINITGGTVNAYSGWYYAFGAGIGGGDDGGCGNITISGNANVKAFNCDTKYTPEGTGIGDGDYHKSGSLTIYGPECVVDTWGLYGIGKGNSNFTTSANPMGGTGKIENGDSYGTAAETDNFTIAWDVTYGERKWRRISFTTSTIDVYYTDEKGEKVGPVTAIDCTTGLPITLGGDSTQTVYYYANSNFSTNVRHEVNCNAMLILGDSAVVSTKGITIEGDNTLTITTGSKDTNYKGTGKITATVSENSMGAAIGCNGRYADNDPYPNSCGNIIINDGTINATAYHFGAGIGSGKNSAEGGSITINGGNVTAYAGTGTLYGYGAGIGGGSNRTNPDIVINGGTIKAYSSKSTQGWGSGIGSGNSAAASNITINGGTIVAAASESGSNYGSGIGGGYDENSKGILVGGLVKIYGDNTDVTTKGSKSIVATKAIAAGANADAVVDYGTSSSDYNTYTAQEVYLLDMNNVSIKDYTYAHIYFEQRKVDVYYTQEDGTVSENAVKAYDCPVYLPDTLGNGTETPVYYFINDMPKQDYRSVVNGNAVIILADDCKAEIAGGITVEEGNTLTITTGDTIKVYEGTGSIDVGSDDTDNAAIGSTQPDGNSSGYAGHTAGTINIYDGTITAHVAEEGSTAETYAAAIGGGAGNGNAGVINITGGSVKAYSAYSGTGNGAGIGGGNGEWFRRQDGGFGGTITISGNAKVEAYSSYQGTGAAAGIGYGRFANRLSDYTGTVAIKGDSTVVIAQGECAIYGTAATAAPDEKHVFVEYGSSSSDYETFDQESQINLFDFNSTSLKSVSYGMVYFAEIPTVEVNIGTTGWASLYYGDYNLEIPDGVKAYIVTAADTINRSLTKVEVTGVIPAGTAVMLWDNDTTKVNTYSFKVTADNNSADLSSNILRGYDVDSTTYADDNGTTEGYYFYKLSRNAAGDNNSVGFYWDVDGGKAFTIPAHKAFMYLKKEEAAGARSFLLNGSDDVTTAIRQREGKETGIIYDLNGRVRGTSADGLPKGIYIKDGKKIVID